MSGPGTEQAAAFCAELVRGHDFDRYASTLFVGPAHRRALLALYAFNVEIVRVRELVTQPLPGEIRLQWWSDMLAGTSHGGVEGNPVAAELQRAISAHALPVAPLTRLIEAHLFDLYNDPMPTLANLEAHLNDTVSTLVGLASQILGHQGASIDHAAHHAGLAQGMARVLATLPFDAARRQLFVPLQLLESQGGDLKQVSAGVSTPQLTAALGTLIAEAQRHLDTAAGLLAEVPAEARAAWLPLALARRDLAQGAQADPFAPVQRSRLATLWTLWRASRSRPFRG